MHPARALAAASTIAKFTHPRHPIARRTGWIGGGTTQPSFKFSKRIRTIRTAAGTNNEYIAICPNASSDVTDVYIKNGTGLSVTGTATTSDATLIGVGSLFADAAFGTGALECRLMGFDVEITPLGSRLNVAGAIQAVLGHEDHIDSATAIDTLVAGDIRSKRVPKVPGKKVHFTAFHHDLDAIMGMSTVSQHHAFGNITDAMAAIIIPPDGANAVQYSLDIIFHWEVAGTQVAQVATPNLHDAPLLEKIHHAASEVHSTLQGVYLPPEQTADVVARKSTGFGFKDLISMAGSVGNFIGGAESVIEGAISGFGSLLPSIAESALPAIEMALPLLAL